MRIGRTFEEDTPGEELVHAKTVGGIADPGLQREGRERQVGRRFRHQHAGRHLLSLPEPEVRAIHGTAHESRVHLLVLDHGQRLSWKFGFSVLTRPGADYCFSARSKEYEGGGYRNVNGRKGGGKEDQSLLNEMESRRLLLFRATAGAKKGEALVGRCDVPPRAIARVTRQGARDTLVLSWVFVRARAGRTSPLEAAKPVVRLWKCTRSPRGCYRQYNCKDFTWLQGMAEENTTQLLGTELGKIHEHCVQNFLIVRRLHELSIMAAKS